jgi:hypothetical protein
LGQAFDDRGLAHAGLAEQDGVVLGPPAQHLDDPLDLVGPADHGVELALAGQFGQVAAEAVQGGGLRLLPTGGGALAAAATAAARFVLVRHGIVPQKVQHFLADVFQLQPEVHEHLGGHPLLFAEEPEQEVFGPDVVMIEVAGFFDRVLDDLLGARGVRQPAHHDLVPAGARLDDSLDLEADLPQVDVEVLQDVGGDPRALLDQPQQDVLGADVLVVEPLCFLVGELHHLPGAVRESLVHLDRLRLWSVCPVGVRPGGAGCPSDRFAPSCRSHHMSRGQGAPTDRDRHQFRRPVASEGCRKAAEL